MTDTTLADRLTALLRRQGLSIAHVAENAGMTKQQVHTIISGKNDNPKIETLKLIVEAAGETLGEFFAHDAD